MGVNGAISRLGALAKNRFGLDAVFVIQISESAIAAARLRIKSFMGVRPFRITYRLLKLAISEGKLIYYNTFTRSMQQGSLDRFLNYGI